MTEATAGTATAGGGGAIAELKTLQRWVVWFEMPAGDRLTKKPFQPSGDPASSTDPDTWASYDEAREAYRRLKKQARFRDRKGGLGIMLGRLEDDRWLVGVDLDLCRSPSSGEIVPDAGRIIEELDSYTEISPSGAGVHVLGYVTEPPACLRNGERFEGRKTVPDWPMPEGAQDLGHKAPEVAIYPSDRYFAVTGEGLEGTPGELEDVTQALAELAREITRTRRGNGADAPGGRPNGADPKALHATGEPSAETWELLRTDRVLTKLWAGLKTSGKDKTRSGHDFALVQRLARRGVGDAEIVRLLRLFPYGQIGSGALQGKAAEYAIGNLLKKAAITRASVEEVTPNLPGELSHDALALALGREQAETVRYVEAWKQWLHWNGRRWVPDEKLLQMTLVRDFLRRIARGYPQSAKALGDARTVASVTSLAKSNAGQATTVDLWDADLWALNTPGGIVDLRTGELRPPDPQAYCIRSTAVTPAPPGTPCPLWVKFLERIFRHDPELVGFIKRLLGYALTGEILEHVLFFAWGEGANGKSTLFNTAAYYCCVTRTANTMIWLAFLDQ